VLVPHLLPVPLVVLELLDQQVHHPEVGEFRQPQDQQVLLPQVGLLEVQELLVPKCNY
jgi:hypothetical protein